MFLSTLRTSTLEDAQSSRLVKVEPLYPFIFKPQHFPRKCRRLTNSVLLSRHTFQTLWWIKPARRPIELRSRANRRLTNSWASSQIRGSRPSSASASAKSRMTAGRGFLKLRCERRGFFYSSNFTRLKLKKNWASPPLWHAQNPRTRETLPLPQSSRRNILNFSLAAWRTTLKRTLQ